MGMKTYRPGIAPGGMQSHPEVAQLKRFTQAELQAIAEAANRPAPSVTWEILHEEPERYAAGDLVFADGTDWDPDSQGLGPGPYWRNEDNDAWEFIGGASGLITASGLTMNTARLLGRTTASAGAIEEITVGTGLSLSAGALTATGTASSLTVQVKTATYNIVSGDKGTLIQMTGATAADIAVTSTSTAATLGNGFFFYLENASTGTSAANKELVFTPTTSTVDGTSALYDYPGSVRLYVSDGTNWITYLINGGYVEVKNSDSPFTLHRPTGFTLAKVACWGTGGSGGGGEGRAAGVGRNGGGAGGGAICKERDFNFSDLSATVTCTVPAAPAGGAGGATAAGSSGTVGGNSTFGTLVIAYGGGLGYGGALAGFGNWAGGGGGGGSTSAGGAGGTNTAGAGGNGYVNGPTGGGAASGTSAGGSGGAAGSGAGGSYLGGGGGGAGGYDAAGTAGGPSGYSSSGGGGGGSVNPANGAFAGGRGSATGMYDAGVTTAAGTTGGGVGGTGADGDANRGGEGGGGGGGNSGGTGGAGGPGGFPGGGGGGGGGGTDTGGAGGTGGGGCIRFWYSP